MTRLPVLVASLAALAAMPLVAAIDRPLGRLGPDNVWCPISTTEASANPAENSDPVILNQGIFELSFVATADFATVEISTEAVGRLDNFLVVERQILFDPVESFASTDCYQSSDPNFPAGRVPVFAGAAIPGRIAWDELFGDDQATLEGLGWTFFNGAAVDPLTSATENTDPLDQSTVTAECPTDGAPACTEGTGSLTMNGSAGNPARVTFQVDHLTPGTTYTFVAWWDFATSDVVNVSIGVPGVPVIPTLDRIGVAGLALVLGLVAIVVLARKRREASVRASASGFGDR